MQFENVLPDIENLGDSQTRWIILTLENFIWPLLVLVFIAFSLLLPQQFFTTQNLRFLLFSSTAIGALALAEGLCLLSGNFDLSIGAIAGFSAMFTAVFLSRWFPNAPGVVGIAVILAIGGIIGLANGFSVAYLNVNPFLQTLAFMIIFTNATPALSHQAIYKLPESYFYLGGGTIASNIPVSIPLIIALYALTWFVLRYTGIGLSVYAVGGNEQSALQAGISTKYTVLLVYTVSGLLSGLAGLLYSGYIGTVSASLTEGTLFVAFASAVIGGISLFGGRGNIIGAFGGVILLGMIQAGLVMLDIAAEMVLVINGVVLLLTILIYTGEERLRRIVLSG